MIFVDTNILIDATLGSSVWTSSSEQALADARAQDVLVTNHVVFAELSAGFSSAEAVAEMLGATGVTLLALSQGAAFWAGQAHAAYRRAGGPQRAILADFLIGGHAAALDAALLTRDRQRFANYFPELKIIAPEKDNG